MPVVISCTMPKMVLSAPNFRRDLLNWYDRHQRSLPWRTPAPAGGRPEPYHVLLSEIMLQQTPVATVTDYFQRFLVQFPTIESLAQADEQRVLRLWQGLGYYSRARNLHRAAGVVMRDHGGVLPATVEGLRELPGIGRYTAAAIASIAFGKCVAAVDGNVTRVLCRLNGIESDPRRGATIERLWSLADSLISLRRPGDFNSAMMELGAIVCRPKSPQCLLCPVRHHCRAFAEQSQDRIPAPPKRRKLPRVRRWTFVIEWIFEGERRFRIERRPAVGRWAGMWQFPTIVAGCGAPADDDVERACPAAASVPRRILAIDHSLTHRRYRFTVFHGVAAAPDPDGIWASIDELDRYPLPKPHVTILAWLRNREASPTIGS